MTKPSIAVALDEPEIREALRGAIEQLAPPSTLRDAEGEGGRANTGVWDELRRGSWLSLAAPVGGADAEALLGLHLLLVENGYAGAPAPITTFAETAYFVAASARSEDDPVVAGLLDGALWTACIPRPGDDLRLADGRLSGTVHLVAHAADAQRLIVPWQQDGRTTWRAVDLSGSRDGVELRFLPTMSQQPLFTVTLDAVESEHICALDDVSVDSVLRLRAFSESATIAGLIWRVLDMTVEHAGTRFQFGRAIGSFQAVQHKLANVTIGGQALMHLSREAALMIGEHGIGDPAAVAAVAEAVNLARRAANLAAQEAHQIWAGSGVSLEFDLQLFTRRLKSAAYRLPEPDDVAGDILSVRFPTTVNN
ncbi:acyl-CoA dehydrogenase [Dactylosporangium sp. NPDC051484]|uniref:acyl-CoA dehydrogenase n=1 Tax=Dactylosporangium sp. NPDC051484 TaxID=3154942 RepID=UPI00344F0CA8